ncbi:Predicted N-acetyltransferase YhbS [Modestobacter sp. DSM 44400]|uniref:GNAT family N-acetyltransferase n=1 Tax=Modestobacter sp. DSM 44400 TaxID=1550230 RepID=UPI0008955F9D|nr:GNAT family N-acetyltransferase [Modestobacter sp. DSM 44400]SDX67641.1 Predicted N-acetyltransferase YhbS [Modestobacter sp. DSM 44400]
MRLWAVRYDDAVAIQLVEQVQHEYVVRYGGRDAAQVDPDEFAAPHGLFLVAEADGEPAGCGGWRVHGTDASGGTVVELKRMYVAPGFRRHGIARTLLAALEATAARAGHREVVLNSGGRQPEALALYARTGYTPVPGYGVYAQSLEAVFLGKPLEELELDEQEEVDGWAS